MDADGSSPRYPTALVGAGRVGTAVAKLLADAGHPITGIWSRSRPSAERASEILQAPVMELDELLPRSELVLIGVTDDALAYMAERVAPYIDGLPLVCHFAGSIGVEPLEALTGTGARVAAMHPVQACPDLATAIRRLPGSAWGVTCDERARDQVSALVEELAGVTVWVDEAHRALWHAAAVATSNGIAALMSIGEALLGSIGVTSPEYVIGPLASGTVSNAREGGGGGPTLTGPIVRGDVDTIKRHMAALAGAPSELRDAYRWAAGLILAGARAAGRVDDQTAAEIREALRG